MGLVNENEIGPCAGVVISEKVALELGLPQMSEVCNSQMPIRIVGFDGKERCLVCNKIHTELVFAQTNPPSPKMTGYGQPQ